MFNTIKLFIASLLFVAVLGGGILAPQRAHAIPVFDAALIAIQTSATVTNVANWATQVAEWVKEELFKALRDQIVKAMVNEINKQTVAWIQGSGSPKFVSDWQGFLKDSVMEGVNQTISQSQLADLCTPFAFQLRIAMIPETRPVSQKAKCSISDIVANVEDFYQNFENGGWLAYGASIKPENNLYMQLVMFDDDMKARSTLSEEKRTQEAAAGSGFLSVSTCLEDNQQELYDQCVADMSQEGGDPNDCYEYAAQAKECTKEKVQTPGDAVAESVGNLVTSENIYISGVQSIISAAINAAINRMMSEGLALMSGQENAAAGYNPSTQYQDQINALDADGKKNLKDQVQPYYDKWNELITYKRTSATYIDQMKTNLLAIKSMQSAGVQCPPQVTDQEISALTPSATKLEREINALQVKIDNAQAVFDRIDSADMTKTRDSLLVTNAIKDFVKKYNKEELITDPNSNYPQQLQAVKDEATAFSASFDLVLARLQTCRTAQGTATTTTP